jgi:4'-phosphopantetheinyl transferase
MLMDNILLDFLQSKDFSRSDEDILQELRIPLFLHKNKIQVWSIQYEHLDRHFRMLSGITNLEGQHNALTFRKSVDARKYILRHGVLRIILGYYTNQNPEQVLLSTGKNGKLELNSPVSHADIFFNLSHSNEMFLIGLSRKHQIGVDIVKLEPSYPFHATAEYILTPAEKVIMQRTEPALRYQIFFRIWALKEAILKAHGGTLTMMKNIDTSEIIQEADSFPYYPIKYKCRNHPFFIWQLRCASGHHSVIAAD